MTTIEPLEQRVHCDAATSAPFRIRTDAEFSTGVFATPQPDGGFLTLTSYYRNGTQGFRRYTATGRPVESFGTHRGTAYHYFSPRGNGRDIEILPDGSFLYLHVNYGSTRSPGTQLARFTPRGRVDRSFARDGERAINLGSFYTSIHMLALPDGKVLLASAIGGHRPRFRLIRLDADGRLDRTFGTDGKLLIEVPAPHARRGPLDLTELLLQDDGKVLVVAANEGGPFSDYRKASHVHVARIDQDGALDPAYGNDGFARAPVRADGRRSSSLRGAALHHGRLTLLAFDGRRAVAMRFDATGRLDDNFGTGGRSRLPLAIRYTYLDMTVVDNGKVLLGFSVDPRSGPRDANRDGNLDTDALFTRLDGSDGRIDPSFGRRGVIRASIGTDDTPAGIINRGDGDALLLVSAGREGTSFPETLLYGIRYHR